MNVSWLIKVKNFLLLLESLLNDTELTDSEIADDGLIYEPLNVGDTLFMGKYDDKDIEWQVLEVENDQALVISQDAICMKEFNMSNRLADWKTSAIREWLNNEFYLYSFDSTERTRIVSTSVNNSYYSVNDYIFLMDESEANLYFDSG